MVERMAVRAYLASSPAGRAEDGKNRWLGRGQPFGAISRMQITLAYRLNGHLGGIPRNESGD